MSVGIFLLIWGAVGYLLSVTLDAPDFREYVALKVLLGLLLMGPLCWLLYILVWTGWIAKKLVYLELDIF